ncbi:hypothetical protein NA57DRAFT_81570 [Rhizodiscina lignyota]|uniref:Uncharacterized protein n=1 Tax=Rhizodiscina lignyota TaxID=1504668 RepID=A0A9P4I5C8_9PEZI|nr:hypothetical protein NA57DRAFT_81570 [Rhizodiscina lignyota]
MSRSMPQPSLLRRTSQAIKYSLSKKFKAWKREKEIDTEGEEGETQRSRPNLSDIPEIQVPPNYGTKEWNRLGDYLTDRDIGPDQLHDWINGSGAKRSAVRFNARFSHPVVDEVVTYPRIQYDTDTRFEDHRDSLKLKYTASLRSRDSGKGKARAYPDLVHQAKIQYTTWGSHSPKGYKYLGHFEKPSDDNLPDPMVGSSRPIQFQEEEEDIFLLPEEDYLQPPSRKNWSHHFSPDGTFRNSMDVFGSDDESDAYPFSPEAGPIFPNANVVSGEYEDKNNHTFDNVGNDNASITSSGAFASTVHPTSSASKSENKTWNKHFSMDGTIRFSMNEDRCDSFPPFMFHSSSFGDNIDASSVITTISELEAKEEVVDAVAERQRIEELPPDHILPATAYAQSVDESDEQSAHVSIASDRESVGESATRRIRTVLWIAELPQVRSISPMPLEFEI